MPGIVTALTQPSTGMDRARLQAFLDFIAGKLSADDYASAVAMLWAAGDPVYAAARNAGTV